MPAASHEVRIRSFGWWLAVAGVTLAGACSTSTFSSAGCKDDACAGAAGTGGSAGRGGSSGGRGGGAGGSEGGGDTGGSAGEETGGSDPGAGRGGKGGGSAGGSGGKGGSGGRGGGASGRGGNDGGAGQGGSGASGGGGAGGSPAGGMGGVAGTVTTAGSAGLGIAGGASVEFPKTPILDTFDRAGGSLGSDWAGSVGNYSISENRLQCAEIYCPGVFWYESFGAVQEVYATLASFDEASSEINLVLKAQGDPDCNLIEILYSPINQTILVEACSDGGWYSLGAVDVRLFPGDQLGGRAREDGYIDVFRNGLLVGTVSGGGYPYIGMGGYVGVNGVAVEDGEPDVWDDFGGGAL